MAKKKKIIEERRAAARRYAHVNHRLDQLLDAFTALLPCEQDLLDGYQFMVRANRMRARLCDLYEHVRPLQGCGE